MTMTIGCDGYDLSILNPTQFKLIFNKIPTVEFFCQAVNLPSLVMTPVKQDTPFLDLHHPGEKFYHQPLRARILLDKKMDTYFEIYKWMKNLSTLNRAVEGFSDCQLIIGDRTFNFYDVFPIELDQVEFDIAATDIQTVTFNVTFEFDYFDLK